MTKEELIDQFGQEKWSFEKDDIYREKLLALSFEDLVIKLRQLANEEAIMVFGG